MMVVMKYSRTFWKNLEQSACGNGIHVMHDICEAFAIIGSASIGFDLTTDALLLSMKLTKKGDVPQLLLLGRGINRHAQTAIAQVVLRFLIVLEGAYHLRLRWHCNQVLVDLAQHITKKRVLPAGAQRQLQCESHLEAVALALAFCQWYAI